MFIFDIEIQNPIAPKNPAEREAGLFYAKDFNDYENMGIACIGVYDYTADKYRVFGEYELDEFRQLAEMHDTAVGFNNIRFDNNVLKANNVVISANKSFDILSEIQSTIGFQKGCRLDDVIKANFPSAEGKTGSGADAPILWQRGYHTKVIDYCLNDVRLTKMLLDRILRFGWIKNPISPDKPLKMKRP
jgi:hypothetical protein